MATEWILLKEAAARMNRSVARVRQYVKEGKLGEQGEGWTRDEFGHIKLSAAVVAAFVPPARGNARATGIKASTTLRHFRAAQAWLEKHMRESDRRRIWVEVTAAAIATLSSKAAVEQESSENVAVPSAPEALEEAEAGEEDFGELMLDL